MGKHKNKIQKPRLIALAFSDLHIHDWKRFNEDNRRLLQDCSVIDLLAKEADRKKVPLLFTGDLAHNPKNLSNRVLDKISYTFERSIQLREVNFVAISGNHDQSERNTISHKSPSYLKTLSRAYDRVKNVDYRHWESYDARIFGIPYLTGNAGLKEYVKKHLKSLNPQKTNILLLHTDYPGAIDTSGREVDTAEGIPKKLLKKFDLVLIGHIHKPQQLEKNTFMLGSPKHQTAGDIGCEMGYWEIYNNRKPKFIPLNNFPQFKYYTGTKPDDFDFWIEKKENKSEDGEDEMTFKNLDNRKKVVKTWCKVKEVRDKKKINFLVNLIEKYDG